MTRVGLEAVFVVIRHLDERIAIVDLAAGLTCYICWLPVIAVGSLHNLVV